MHCWHQSVPCSAVRNPRINDMLMPIPGDENHRYYMARFLELDLQLPDRVIRLSIRHCRRVSGLLVSTQCVPLLVVACVVFQWQTYRGLFEIGLVNTVEVPAVVLGAEDPA